MHRPLNLHSISLFILSLLFYIDTPAQVTVSGPTCVVPNIVYQYRISGNWDSASILQVCLQNGFVADSSGTNSCSSNASPVSFILVQWSSAGAASLAITSSKGNTSYNVNVVEPLTPGSVDTAIQNQTVFYTAIPETITCAIDTGGSCAPNYQYQWQQSPDMFSWNDIAGANVQNLGFNAPLSVTTFYRRKVTEVSSGSIAYSNAAVVNVNIYLPSGDTTARTSDSISISSNLGNQVLKRAPSVFEKSVSTCFLLGYGKILSK